MLAESTKNMNILGGTVFGALGVAAWLAAGYVSVTPAEPIPAPVIQKAEVDKESCRQSLSSLGYYATVANGRIFANEPNLDDPQGQLSKASLGIAVCKGIPLAKFCMGDACEKYGVTFELGANSTK